MCLLTTLTVRGQVTISCPPDVTVTCQQEVHPPYSTLNAFINAGGSISDISEVDPTTYSFTMSSTGSCPTVITSTYFIQDIRGELLSCDHTTVVLDTLAPILLASAPDDITVECVDDVPGNTQIFWVDNCQETGASTSVTELISGECPKVYARMWTATDICGNSATEIQHITVDDQTFPVLLAQPADTTVACLADIPEALQIEVIDNCDGVAVVTSTDMYSEEDCRADLLRTWNYSDNCGNTVSYTQRIEVLHTEAIELRIDSVTVGCPDDAPMPDPRTVEVIGGCSETEVIWAGDDTVGFTTNGQSCQGFICRRYTSSDECGDASVEQVIRVADLCAPGEPCPTCESDVPSFLVDFTDNPDSFWISPNVVRRRGGCCGQLDKERDHCVEFTLVLPHEVMAISFTIPAGALPPGQLNYKLNCDETVALNEIHCIDGASSNQIVFCAPGTNPNIYTIRAYSQLPFVDVDNDCIPDGGEIDPLNPDARHKKIGHKDTQYQNTRDLTSGTGPARIYPNPASDNVTVGLSEDLGVLKRLVIYDQTGSIVGQNIIQSGPQRIDVSMLASGIYFIAGEAENGQFLPIGRFVRL